MLFADQDNLVDLCLEATGRAYGDGYGHAIIYCRDAANATIQLHKAACAVVAYAYSDTGRRKHLYKDSDIAGFTRAMAELPFGGAITRWRDTNGRPIKPAPGRTIQMLANGKSVDGWTRVEFPATYGWLIEGCQLVLQTALDDNYPKSVRALCAAAMKAAGHPGY